MFPMSKKYFLKREEGLHHGGVKITAATHLPRVYTEDEALELAAEIIETVGEEKAGAFLGPRLAGDHERAAELQAIADKLPAKE